MKKSFYVVGGILISMLLTTPNVWATTKAYSVGSKYASTIDPSESDFRQNVINAAEGYYPHSSLTASYYTNNPNYSYINGTKLGTSRVWFINGHATPDEIATAAQDSTEYRTGIARYTTNPYNDTFFGKTFKFVGIGNRSFAATNIISFVGCSTGYSSTNITKTANAKGAKASIGFTNTIISRFGDGPNWLKKYNYSLGADNSVATAISQATTAYPNSNLGLYVIVYGNTGTKIGTSNSNSISPSLESVDESYAETKLINPNVDMKEYQEVRMNLDELYYHISSEKIDSINFKNMKKNIGMDNLSNYEKEFGAIIEKIKSYDNSFTTKDYKISYNMINETDGFGILNFYYFIDGKIETNKVYSSTINDYKVVDIYLAGLRKENIEKASKIEINTLFDKINIFEENKLQNLKSKTSVDFKNSGNILKNNKINNNSLDENIISAEEKYYYDYNSQKLQYKLILEKDLTNNVKDKIEYSIDL